MEIDNWVAIALLGKARGIRGEITAIPLSTRLDRYDNLTEVYLFGDGRCYQVEETWWHDARLIFKFQGIDTRNDAERLQGAEVRVPFSERVELDPGEYFEVDLVGCTVYRKSDGATLGMVRALADGGGAAGLLELDNGLLVPFVRAILVEIDPAAKRIVANLPEGLEELNRPAGPAAEKPK